MKAKILAGLVDCADLRQRCHGAGRGREGHHQGQESPDNFGGSGLDDTTQDDLIILDQEDVAPVPDTGVQEEGVGGAGLEGRRRHRRLGPGPLPAQPAQPKAGIPIQGQGGMTLYCTPVQAPPLAAAVTSSRRFRPPHPPHPKSRSARSTLPRRARTPSPRVRAPTAAPATRWCRWRRRSRTCAACPCSRWRRGGLHRCPRFGDQPRRHRERDGRLPAQQCVRPRAGLQRRGEPTWMWTCPATARTWCATAPWPTSPSA